MSRAGWWLIALAVCAACRNPQPAETPSRAQRSDAAYRANNRGVALLEQFSHESAVAAFREALQNDPALRLARINLPIALFYAGRMEEAAREAARARTDFSDAPQPIYLLGLIARAENRPDDAANAFGQVLALDPSDSGAKLSLAILDVEQRQYREAIMLCQSVLADEPFNATAAYNLALALIRSGDKGGGARAMRSFEQLRNAPYAITYSQTYLEQGRYAQAIASTGAELDLVSAATPEVTFADATDTLIGGAQKPEGSEAPPLPLAGAVMLADIDRDDDLDVITAGPAIRVYRNDRGRLVDSTSAIGLSAVPRDVTGVLAGDLTGDDRTDFVLLTEHGARLFTQDANGTFRDTTPDIFATVSRPARAGALVDVDHDGDLDVFVGGFTARTPRGPPGWGFVRSGRPTNSRLLRNNRNGTFSDVSRAAGVQSAAAVAAVIPTDYDNRRDIDLLMITYASPPRLYKNLRTGSFENVARAAGFPDATDFTAAATADVNKDGSTDIFLGRESSPGLWAVSDGRGRFRTIEAPSGSEGANAAQMIDYDNDGLPDLMLVSQTGPHLFRNLGRSWTDQTGALGGTIRDARVPVSSLAAGDLDMDGDDDVVAHLQGGTIRIWRNDGGNRNRSLRVNLRGRASNHAGIGARLELRAGSLYTHLETMSATPSIAVADAVFGLGSHSRADVVRVLWPSGILQSETAGAAALQLAITELDRKPSSCPYLFTWDGQQFTFVTDFMGGSEMGYLETPGIYNVPDPDEYVRITDRQLRERNGRYELRVTNELEEALFADQLTLLAVTHPADADVFPDEGMRVRPSSFKLYTVQNVRPPLAAVDDDGRSVMGEIATVDRQYAAGFGLEPVRGYSRAHSVTLGLPPASSPRVRTALLLTGWTDYAFSTDNIAGSQAGLTLSPPVLQVSDTNGVWRTVNADVGVPVGRPQTLILDVTQYASRRIRLLTSMRVYWDQIAVADASTIPVSTTAVPLVTSVLRWRGFSTEFAPDGKEPYGYNYSRVVPVAPWKLMPGRYTREGDVAELLQHRDDRFVISRPGDEIALSFDASVLPPVPAGMRRTFLLHAVGYSKEMDLYSASPDSLTPIPFSRMTRYPYKWPERYPHEQDFERFHTRIVGRSIPTLAP